MKLDRRTWIQLAGLTGLILLIIAYVWYTTVEQLELVHKVLFIAGGVLILAWLILDFRSVAGFFSKRSSKLGTNTGVLIIAVLAILVFVNYLGLQHHKTFDLTSEKLYTLSDQTKKIVTPIKADVNIYLFAKSADQEVPQVKNQMAEYTNLNRHIHFEVVDPQERPDMAKKYGVTQPGQLVVVSGNSTQKLEDTTEQNVTSAILKATSTEVKTVCFIEGHGEESITATDGRGFSQAADELGKENYKVKAINLVSSGSVPSDCSVLVDPGPKQSLFPQEAQMIGKYLDGGGKALLLFDPGTDPKIQDVLQSWNVNLGDNYVIDVSGVGRLMGAGPGIPLVVDYGVSPIVQNFEHTMTFFPLARTVSLSNSTKTDPEGVELLKTSPASFTVPSLGNGTVRYDPVKDQRGPLSLGVAAEKKSGSTDPRLVVIGNSEFATNQWVGQQRNGDLFYNAVNWLASESNLISIRPKQPTNRRVTLTEAQQRGLSWFSMIFLPLIVIVGGVVMWLRRR